ncbi:MAG: copper chaperone PCu(A)C [Gallionella sp.]|nr:copper chaperone PCu(A)C [Gallionella sp.]
MINLFRFGGLLALFLCSSAYAGDIQIQNAWARATAPGQDAASVDLTITSKHAAALVGVSSPAAETAALHSMQMEGGMMRMREVASLDIPPGKALNLRASGHHLMLMGLKEPLKEGQTVPLTLNFRVGKMGMMKVKTRARVIALTAPAPVMGNSGDQKMNMKMH